MRIILATLVAVASSLTTAAVPPRLADARQLIVVTTADWNTVRGELRRYEGTSATAPWKAIGAPIPMVVGRNGLAWDPVAEQVVAGPVKREGDGRAPAGVFSLGTAFGYAPSSEVTDLKLPYLHITEGVECVDDVKSTRYNTIVNRRSIASTDWTSSEKMREVGEAYHWGVVVNYNTPPAIGRGSCIFLHVGGGPDSTGTAGCTAMSQPELREMMRWLDPAKKPVMVQLPAAVRDAVKTSWALP
jgi:D-alanyl-D-alanine dipeptidase